LNPPPHTEQNVPAARDKLLFTPGPLTTSLAVKQAMLHDAGSWHFEFNALVASIRLRLLDLAGVTQEKGWETVLLQGSGTFGVEAVFQTSVPLNGKVLVLVNGAYGDRMAKMLAHARMAHTVIRTSEDVAPSPAALQECLVSDPAITHVAAVHCETTTGILNPIEELGGIAKTHNKVYIVDAMSSFGGMPIDLEKCGIDFLISSPNKCLESVPGFCFTLCRRAVLLACEGRPRSLSLDLLDQLKAFEKNGQFRFTPPTHSLLAFDRALDELENEGGIVARALRYRRNHETLLSGMVKLRFETYLPPPLQSHFITAFRYPSPEFNFDCFYRTLSDRGFIIYPGKLTRVDTFRIGTIGRLFPHDFEQLACAIEFAVRQ
jgi:2-aminoethylphosphonate-pyruvate transaminase